MTDPNTPAWLRYQSALAQDASEQTGSIAAAFMARSLALRAEAAETDERVAASLERMAASLSRCRALLDQLEALEPADLVFTDKTEGDTWSDYVDPRGLA